MNSSEKVALIIPAFNEENRVSAVIKAAKLVPIISEIIVVSDGSSDNTAAVAESMGVRVERLSRNVGKGGAMRHGALCAVNADVVVFLDADLIGLKPDHIESLAAPVVRGACAMAIGQFIGGRGVTDLAQNLVKCISGQRAIRRDLFLSIPSVDSVGYGVEMLITLHVSAKRLETKVVQLNGVTHPMKEEKHGFVLGALARTRMYWQMLKFWFMYHFNGIKTTDLPASVHVVNQGNVVISNGSGQDHTIDSVQNAPVAR